MPSPFTQFPDIAPCISFLPVLKHYLSSSHARARSLGLLLLGCCVLGLCSGCTDKSPAESSSPTVKAAPLNSVVALGRIVPRGEVIKLSVPNAQDSRVNQILVKEGDFVQMNQVIAILQGIDRRQADLNDAVAEVKLRQAELRKAQQGETKPAEKLAQAAKIEQLKAQLKSERLQKQAAIANVKAVLAEAKRTYQRRQTLQKQGAISLADFNIAERDLEAATADLADRQAALQQTVTTLEASIRQEEAVLENLKQIRPVDVEIAQAQLEKAQVAVAQRRADLDDVRVRAPVAGQILRINTQIGEQVNTAQGIVELAGTQQMYAIAEIYETDVAKVRKGQRAILSTDYGGFKGEVRGTVEHIGLQIGRKTIQETSTTNPTTDQDARVVEVKIRIDPQDSRKVASFTNMLVQVKIQTKI
jgi:HlyD family secretion protein